MNPLSRLTRRLQRKPTCQKVNRFLADYLDGMLPSQTEEEFRAHLNDCPRCVEYFNQYKATIDLVRKSGEVAVPDKLAEHTLQFLRSNADFDTGPDESDC